MQEYIEFVSGLLYDCSGEVIEVWGKSMNLDFDTKVKNTIEESHIYREEPMKKHTTFRVGGNADYFITPGSLCELEALVSLCKETAMPYYVVGNGSNLLVSDEGYRGVIIQIGREMSDIRIEENRMQVQAGAMLSAIGNAALRSGLTGFEFAAGIPGTLGGAVVMNAGAYGGEMKDVLDTATVLTPEGERMTLSNRELEFSYRTSIVSKKGYIVLEASLSLSSGDRESIKAKMEELRAKRKEKQPLEYPSAGSTFKRPEGYFAGKLIQDAQLRGFQVGGAKVSEKHCGFVINEGNATAADIWELICRVSAVVKEKFGVELEPEVKRLGEFKR